MHKAGSPYTLLLFFLLFPVTLDAQITHHVYADAGSSVVSSGLFIGPAFMVSHRYGDYYGGTGFRWTFPAEGRNSFSGWHITGGKDFTVKDADLSASLFYLRNPFSYLIAENNVGLLLRHERSHLAIHAGYHMRSYRLLANSSLAGDPAEYADRTIREYRNFIYRGTLRLKDPAAPWNLSVSVTNYDWFLLQQETNPMIVLEGTSRVTDALELNASFWYRGAGMLNLHFNHFGYHFRTGIVWRLER
jgi:hypothetical protein